MRDIIAFSGGILARLHPYFPEAVVVGGAIRDYDNGKGDTVKDLDIVIFDRRGYLADLKKAMEGYQHRVAVPEMVANYLSFENVAVVHEFFWDHRSVPIQVIVMKEKRSLKEILERHDFGFCQIGYDGSGIIATQAYLKDKYDHTFTLVRCRDHKDYWRSMQRYQRISTKYPFHRLVVTEACK